MIVVVADASPLIALDRIGRLELLKALFDPLVGAGFRADTDIVERVLKAAGEEFKP